MSIWRLEMQKETRFRFTYSFYQNIDSYIHKMGYQRDILKSIPSRQRYFHIMIWESPILKVSKSRMMLSKYKSIHSAVLGPFLHTMHMHMHFIQFDINIYFKSTRKKTVDGGK